MPKLKTRRAAAKRFKRSGSGKFIRRRAFKSHLLEHKSAARKTRLGQKTVVRETETENISLMMPYS